MMIPMLVAAMTNLTHTPEALYIGTYTHPGGSEGIYSSTLDPATGKLSRPMLAAKAENPSYLAVHPNGKSLYAVLEFTGGEVVSFGIGSDGRLTLLNKQSWKGGGPCHVSLDKKGKWLLAAAYGQGSLGCFPVEPDGKLGSVSSVLQNEGSGPNRQRQDGPHMHSSYFFGSKILACDLGTDQVFLFDFPRGTLTPASTPFVRTECGGGPRHLAFHPNGKYVFANLEMGNSVCAYTWDGAALKLLQTLKTLPSGTEEKGKTTAAIVCHPNGKWLYVSNRGHDSIAVFSISSRGLLKLVCVAPAGVKEPRGMALDPSGKWLVVGGQNSNDLVSLRIDRRSGKLSEPASRVSVGTPVCVVFR